MSLKHLEVAFLAIVLSGAICFSSSVPCADAETLNPGLESRLKVSNTGESWTDEWHVIDTAVELPGGGRAGFYRRAERKGSANPQTGRNGILYLYPEGSYRPARILGKEITLPEGNPRLELGVAANSNPRGDWKLIIKVNDRQLFEDVVITDSDGWQDLVFDLGRFGGQRVDIVIEAGRANSSSSFVFIDYIKIGSGPIPSGPESDRAVSMEDQGLIDRNYRYFLELLDSREEKRSQRLQDQVYQDQQQRDQRFLDQGYRDQQRDVYKDRQEE